MTPDLIGFSIILLFYFGYICINGKFCKEYLEISKINKKLFVIFGFCGGIVINALDQYYSIPNIALTLLNHLFFAGLILLLFQGNTEKKILVISILITITTLMENFCVSFFSGLILVWQHTGKNIAVPFLSKEENNLIICLSLAITIWVIYGGINYLSSVFYGKTGRWYITLAIPLIAITEIIDIANWGASNGILIRSGGDRGVYYDQIFSHIEIYVLAALSIFGAGFFVFGMNKIYLEQKKSSQYHLQIAAYKMLEEQYHQSERLRHDLKNHMIVLRGLLEHREWEKIEDYLKSMGDSASLNVGEEVTGNKGMDILLCQKRKIAERKNIIWECDVQFPQIYNIDEFDLCILFGNILDNAIEACERLQVCEGFQVSERLQDKKSDCRQQFINIQARVIKKCFLIEVKNSTSMKDNPKIGFTCKENPEKHGIGLLNIRDVIHKYNGTMNMQIQDGIFIISLLIPLNNSADNIK